MEKTYLVSSMLPLNEMPLKTSGPKDSDQLVFTSDALLKVMEIAQSAEYIATD